MIVCSNCGSDNVDAGLVPQWPGMGLYTVPGRWLSVPLAWLGMILLDAHIPILGAPLLAVGFGWGLYLTVRHIARFGLFGVGIYHPTPCRCRHCGHEWVEMPKH